MPVRVFHEGQFEGHEVRLPVFLGRRPDETVDQDAHEVYKKLFKAVNRPIFREGKWSLCDQRGWSDNTSLQNLVAWNWVKDEGDT